MRYLQTHLTAVTLLYPETSVSFLLDTSEVYFVRRCDVDFADGNGGVGRCGDEGGGRGGRGDWTGSVTERVHCLPLIKCQLLDYYSATAT